MVKEKVISMYKNNFFVKISVMILLLFLGGKSYSQIGTEFWFDMPEHNLWHDDPDPINGIILHVASASDFSATVTIEVPAFPAFRFTAHGGNATYSFTVPAGTEQIVDLKPYMGAKGLTGVELPIVEPANVLENVLLWSSTDVTPTNTRPYINRTKKGICMKSDYPITAYLEYNGPVNMDLIALKGPNAKGKEFYIPMQTSIGNVKYNSHRCPPYSSFNIVATENDTKITIKTKQALWLRQGTSHSNLPAGTYTIWLNKGESSIIAPYAVGQGSSVANGYKDIAQYPNDKLDGTYVKVETSEGLGGDIVILSRDDLAIDAIHGYEGILNSYNPAYPSQFGDVDMDQLVPITLAGKDFGVVQGIVSSNNDADVVFIVATQDGTEVRASGKEQWYKAILNAGEQCAIQIATTGTKKAAAIHTTKPVIVYHLSGSSVQKAGAVIPALPESGICVGSKEVVVSRASDSYPVYLNLLAWDSPTSASSLGKFVIQVQPLGGGPFQDVTTGLLKQLQDTINKPGKFKSFEPITGIASSPLDKWKWAQINASAYMKKGTPIRVINNGNVFHLGILNGTNGGGNAMYGYFSDFKSFVAQAYAGGDKDNPISYMPVCYGQTTQITATGGNSYSWSPTDFLSNPNIASPYVVNPTASKTYTATVSGACDLTSTTSVTVEVSPPINPTLTPSSNFLCGDGSVTFTAGSLTHVTKLKWYVKVPGATSFPSSPERTDNIPGIVSHNYIRTFTYTGDGVEPVDYTLRLVASNDGCPIILESVIKVYPAVDVNPMATYSDPNGCTPLTVNFSVGGGGIPGVYYRWEFGDGTSSNTNNPTHKFYNYSTTDIEVDTVKVTITDKHNVCSVAKKINISIKPLVDAHFVIDPIGGCSPITLKATSDSKPFTIPHQWYIDGVLKTTGGGVPITSSVINHVFNHSGATSEDAETHVIRLGLTANSCSDFHENAVYVYPKPEIGTVMVTPLPTSDAKCSPLDVKFSATGLKNATSYYWQVTKQPTASNISQNVGAGTLLVSTSTVELSSFTFTNNSSASVTYEVKLVVNNKWGCEVSKAVSITINPYVEANVVIDKEQGCSPLTVSLTNASSSGATIFQWNINGTTYNTKTVSSQIFTYPSGAPWDNSFNQYAVPISLTAKNSAGCTRTFAKTIYVNPQATANFTYDLKGNTNACSPVNVDFDGTYMNAEFYQWQFGDLGSSTDVDPSFILNNTTNAVKPVKVDLIASNRYNCNAPMVSKIINVQPEIKTDFSLSNSASCVPFTFNVSAPPTAGTYSWEILRGSTTFFTGSGNSHALNVNANKTGSTETYKVTLSASNGTCTAPPTTKFVLAYPEVEAKWSLPDAISAACSPLNLSINNLSTLYNSGVVLPNILWEISDGGTFNVSSINTTLVQSLANSGYESPKSYTLKLTASSADGCSATKTSPIVVNPPVNAAFNTSVVDACTPMQLQFNDASQVKIGTPYVWNWDGGTIVSSAGQNYLMKYTNLLPELSENKTVTLKLTNSYGCYGETSYSFVVNPRVVAGLSIDAASSDNICAPDNVTFKNNSTGGVVNYMWDFGDGANRLKYDNGDVTHQFTNRNSTMETHYVTLTATNALGCTSTTTALGLPIYVYPEVDAIQSFTLNNVCTPTQQTEVNLTNSSLNGSMFTWTFTPDNAGGIAQTITPTSTGYPKVVLANTNSDVDVNYSVAFNAKTIWNSGLINEITCQDNAVGNAIIVAPQLSPNFSVALPQAVCSGSEITFANNGTKGGAMTLTWDFGDGQSGASLKGADIKHKYLNTTSNDLIPEAKVTAVQILTGCSRVWSLPIRVHPKVKADFAFVVPDYCAYPLKVDFLNASLGSTAPAGVTTNYAWDYGYSWGVPASPQGENRNNKNPHSYYFYNANPNANALYTIRLANTQVHTVSGLTCAHDTLRTITVIPELLPKISIPIGAEYGCSDYTLTFNNTSTGGPMNFVWDFANGNSAATTNVSQIVTEVFTYRGTDPNLPDPTHYPVKLTATNSKGCVKDAIKDIYVYPKVEANFTMDYNPKCTPFEVTFTNNSLNGQNFHWDYGYTLSGISQKYDSNRPSLTHNYTFDNESTNTIKNYTITLTAKTVYAAHTCQSSVTRNLEVYPKVEPNFMVSPLAGCNPVNVTLSKNVAGLATDSYLWDLSNGMSFNTKTPFSVNLENPSNENVIDVNVKLTTTNALGCKKESTQTVKVAPKVIASFSTSIKEGCDSVRTSFTNLTPSNAYNYTWKIDGVTKLNSPIDKDFNSVLFKNTTKLPTPSVKTYNVELTSTYTIDGNVCSNTANQIVTVNPSIYPDFIITNKEACHPLVTNIENKTNAFSSSNAYLWNLGDGTFSTSKEFMVVGSELTYKNNSAVDDVTYNIKLKATSEHGCTHDTTLKLTVHPRPIASFVMDNESLSCSPFSVKLNNESVGQGTLDYAFDLDDGPIITTSVKDPISHTYRNFTSTVKPYNITLTASTASGCTNSTSQTIYAYPEVTAKFSLNPGNAACSPFVVGFDNTTTNGYFYQWSFDDGSNSNLMSPNHRFVNITENDQTFDVRLKSISAYDCEDDTIIPVTVYATPVANFSVNPPLKVYPDATFNFHNQSNPAADGWVYSWNFGDNYTSNLKEAGNHTYTEWAPKSTDHIYTATLKVDAPHCSSFTSNTLRLLPTVPIPFFNADIYKSCSPLEVHFVNQSEYGGPAYGGKFIWDFGDGTTSTEGEPIHTFTKPGYYNVKLTVTGDGGISYYFKTFRVFENPVANFAVYPNHVMLPDAEVHIYNLSKYAHRYEWDLGDGTLLTDKDPVHKYAELGEYKISLRAYAHDTLGGCQDFTSLFPAVWVEGQGLIKFPDAFIPSKTGSNGGVYDEIDYKNEVFHPIHYGVVEYKLMVFNRWGEQIFQSNDIKIGWDGYFNSKLCDQGVYIWRAIGKYTNGKAFDRKGNVTLLR